MARVPMWAAVLIAIAGVIAIVQGWGGLTFQWACDDYTRKKAAEAIQEGSQPHDSYSFVGLGVGFCLLD
jgi:hypothetical protein